MGEYTVREVLKRRSAETVRKLQQRRALGRKDGEGQGTKVLLVIVLLLLSPVVAYVGWVAKQALATGITAKQTQVHVFMRPLKLAPATPVTLDRVRSELARLGYHPISGEAEPEAGQYRITEGQLVLHTRGFRFASGAQEPHAVKAAFTGGKLSALEVDGQAAAALELEPLALGNIEIERGPERLPLTSEEIPDRVRRMLAAELDPRFATRGMFDAALDPTSIARRYAAIKLEDSPRAWALEIDAPIVAAALVWNERPSALIEAYINEVHLATEGSREVHGFGLGASFLFGRPLMALEVHQQALLVALAAQGDALDARKSPTEAREARDAVLERAAAEDALLKQESVAGKLRELDVLPFAPSSVAFDPELLQFVQSELLRDYAEGGSTPPIGARVFTTLDPEVQLLARGALMRARDRLANRGAGVEGAIVVLSHERNEVLAVVGSLGTERTINHALDAVRPVGTMALPATYLTAVNKGYGPLTTVDDSALEIELPDGRVLTPRNPNGRNHGRESLVAALAGGHSVAFTRVALEAGVQSVVEDLRRLGAPRAVPSHPAAIGGAFMLSPYEVAQMYSTILRMGRLAPMYSVATVIASEGTERQRRTTLRGSRSLEEGEAYLLLRALQHAARTGPARSSLALGTNPAALVGASDGAHDAWAAGGDGSHVIVAWYGRKDEAAIGMPGVGAAGEALGAVLGALGGAPLKPARPAGVADVWVEPNAGVAIGAGCQGAVQLAFPEKLAPAPTSECRGGAAAALKRLLGPR
jgi:penicillin-binding protein 1B